MLDYLLLSEKPNVSLYKDDEYVTFKDLTCKTFNGNSNENLGNIVIVDENYVARPDLISLAIYGDDKYADIICKVNGISNPFELNKDMVIYVPTMSQLNDIHTGTKYENDVLDEFKHKYIGNKRNRLFNKITETIEKRKNNFQKLKNERRSPGEQTITDNNYYIDKTLGIVIY